MIRSNQLEFFSPDTDYCHSNREIWNKFLNYETLWVEKRMKIKTWRCVCACSKKTCHNKMLNQWLGCYCIPRTNQFLFFLVGIWLGWLQRQKKTTTTNTHTQWIQNPILESPIIENDLKLKKKQNWNWNGLIVIVSRKPKKRRIWLNSFQLVCLSFVIIIIDQNKGKRCHNIFFSESIILTNSSCFSNEKIILFQYEISV